MDHLRWNTITFLLVLLLVSVLTTEPTSSSNGSFYDNNNALRKFLISDKYDTQTPPITNMGGIVNVTGKFVLIEIASLEDVKQDIVTSGYFHLLWKDHIRNWNPSDFGGITFLETQPTDVWRPSLQIMNAVENRDPFHDQTTYLSISSDGQTDWHPTGLFQTNCDLTLASYPFDVQNCTQQMCPTYNNATTLRLNLDQDIDMRFFKKNSNWELLRYQVVNEMYGIDDHNAFSCINIQFKLRRVITSKVSTLFIPLLVLPILIVLVFKIPVDSGKHIACAITVVLSMVVSQETINASLPTVSDMNPFFAFYALVNVTTSVLAVPAVIWTGQLRDRYELSGSPGKSGRIRLTPSDARLVCFFKAVVDVFNVTQWKCWRSRRGRSGISVYETLEVDNERGGWEEEEAEEGEGSGLDDGEDFLQRAIRTGCFKDFSTNVSRVLFTLFAIMFVLSTVWFLAWALWIFL